MMLFVASLPQKREKGLKIEDHLLVLTKLKSWLNAARLRTLPFLCFGHYRRCGALRPMLEGYTKFHPFS